MSVAVAPSLMGLDDGFPDLVWVSQHVPTGKYWCYCHDGIHGLAVFSDQWALKLFRPRDEEQCPLQVSFDEAREIAKSRPLPVVCLMLLDDLEHPKIHYVR